MAWECFPGVFLQDCCLPGRGEVGHTINLQATSYSRFFPHWSCIFLKNFSTPSVGEIVKRKEELLEYFFELCNIGD